MDQVHTLLLYSLCTKAKILDLYYNKVLNKDIENEIEERKRIVHKTRPEPYIFKIRKVYDHVIPSIIIYSGLIIYGNCMNFFPCNNSTEKK